VPPHAIALPPPLTARRPRGFERPVSLAEVLDRVLTKGAVVTGEVVISVAGIDLVYLALNVVLTSVDTARNAKADAHRSSHVQA
jgi:hypothetical protein